LKLSKHITYTIFVQWSFIKKRDRIYLFFLLLNKQLHPSPLIQHTSCRN
jgi:hypothetical protein